MRTYAQWTEEEDAYILQTPFARPADVAAALDRTPSGVQNRRKKLRVDRGLGEIFGPNVTPFKPGNRTLVAKTCLGCGHLLSDRWFKRYKPSDTSSGGYLKRCERCRRDSDPPQDPASLKRPYAALQRETQDLASNSGKEWTERDMEILADPSMSKYEKALTLKRSYASVCRASQKRGLSAARSLGDPSRDGWHIDNPNFKETA